MHLYYVQHSFDIVFNCASKIRYVNYLFMTTSPKTTINIIDLTDQVLAVLDARSRDVISRRYGIKNGQSETLEGIGKD